MYYAESCNEFAGFSSSLLHPGSASFVETSQRWRAVGNTVSDLTGPRFEAQPPPPLNTYALPLDQLAGTIAPIIII